MDPLWRDPSSTSRWLSSSRVSRPPPVPSSSTRLLRPSCPAPPLQLPTSPACDYGNTTVVDPHLHPVASPPQPPRSFYSRYSRWRSSSPPKQTLTTNFDPWCRRPPQWRCPHPYGPRPPPLPLYFIAVSSLPWHLESISKSDHPNRCNSEKGHTLPSLHDGAHE
jgi:hypothetical protein